MIGLDLLFANIGLKRVINYTKRESRMATGILFPARTQDEPLTLSLINCIGILFGNIWEMLDLRVTFVTYTCSP
jgi:hypothetical protein